MKNKRFSHVQSALSRLSQRKAQEQKSKILVATPKKAQEEMVGFALIIIVVSVILLIFLGFSLKSNQKGSVESYEVESFIQSFLQHTTACEDNFEHLSVKKLIYKCQANELCADGKDSCQALSEGSKSLVENSWKVGSERPVKGYELSIKASNKSLVNMSQGNKTINSKAAIQYLPREVEVYFIAYY